MSLRHRRRTPRLSGPEWMPTLRGSQASEQDQYTLATCLKALAHNYGELDEGTLREGMRHLGRVARELDRDASGVASH